MEFPNFQAMLAKVYRVYELDWTYIVWTMREALEEKPGHDDRKRGRGTQESYVIAAANWIIYAGDSVRMAVKDRKLQPDDSKASEGGELFKGKAGLTAARWSFWQHRFEKFGAFLHQLPDTRRTIEDFLWSRQCDDVIAQCTMHSVDNLRGL